MRRLAPELGHSFDANQQRAVDVFLGGNDIAHPQTEQLARAQPGPREADLQFHQRAAEHLADLLDAFGGGLAAAIGDPAIGREFAR